MDMLSWQRGVYKLKDRKKKEGRRPPQTTRSDGHEGSLTPGKVHVLTGIMVHPSVWRIHTKPYVCSLQGSTHQCHTTPTPRPKWWHTIRRADKKREREKAKGFSYNFQPNSNFVTWVEATHQKTRRVTIETKWIDWDGSSFSCFFQEWELRHTEEIQTVCTSM